MKKISKKLELLFLLSKTTAILARRFSSQGLGFGDLAVMYSISQSTDGKIRRTDLAEQLGLTASGVTRLLLPLEKIGVIRREVNERDARVSYTTLTASGKRMLEDSLVSVEVTCENLIPQTNNETLEKFSGILKNIK